MFTTQDKGRGIMTSHSFHEGDYLCEYYGDLIDAKEASRRERVYKEKGEITFWGGCEICASS